MATNTPKAQTGGPSEKAKATPPAGGWAQAPAFDAANPESPLHKFNINTVSQEVLSKIPQMTGTRAQMIVDRRIINGPYHRLSEVKNISGISEGMMEAITDRLYCGDPEEPSPREKYYAEKEGNINA